MLLYQIISSMFVLCQHQFYILIFRRFLIMIFRINRRSIVLHLLINHQINKLQIKFSTQSSDNISHKSIFFSLFHGTQFHNYLCITVGFSIINFLNYNIKFSCIIIILRVNSFNRSSLNYLIIFTK